MLERRKNTAQFPVPSRIINGLFRIGGMWQQLGDIKTKVRREAGLLYLTGGACWRRRSVFCDHRAAKTVAHPDRSHVDVLADVVAARDGRGRCRENGRIRRRPKRADSKKAGARPAFSFRILVGREAQYRATTGPPQR
jgi:hypothetical protein